MTEIINRVAELRKDIETGKLIDVIEISVELIRIESLLQIKQIDMTKEEQIVSDFLQLLGKTEPTNL